MRKGKRFQVLAKRFFFFLFLQNVKAFREAETISQPSTVYVEERRTRAISLLFLTRKRVRNAQELPFVSASEKVDDPQSQMRDNRSPGSNESLTRMMVVLILYSLHSWSGFIVLESTTNTKHQNELKMRRKTLCKRTDRSADPAAATINYFRL